VKAGDGGNDLPNRGVGTYEGGLRRGIERRVKDQVAERAQAVVSDDLGWCIELPGNVALMKMRDRNELGGENEDDAEERNRFCATSDRPRDSSPPRNHQLTNSIATALRRYPPV